MQNVVAPDHKLLSNLMFTFVRSFTETLDEKDLGREDEDDVLDSQEQSAPPQIKSAKGMLVRHDSAEECITARLGVEEEQVVELDEEEDVIEDFDDG